MGTSVHICLPLYIAGNPMQAILPLLLRIATNILLPIYYHEHITIDIVMNVLVNIVLLKSLPIHSRRYITANIPHKYIVINTSP